MALQGSGQITLGEIAAEYGGSAPHALSEYHDKGNAPASGEIQIAADFYGTSNIFNYTISSNTSNLNMRSGAVSAGWGGSSPLYVTINSGVTVYSGSTGSYAMVIDGSYPGGVTLTNNGTILGKGGDGGRGSSSHHNGCGWGQSSVYHGASGGPALQISSAVTIVNANGRISGGGGGGGMGGQYQHYGLHSGGGGGGIGNGAGGVTQGGSTAPSGTLTSAGGGGGYVTAYMGSGYGCGGGWHGGNGGAGGSWGASGSGGSVGSDGDWQGISPAGNGGSGGAATSGASNVTWTSTGTRNGSVG